MESKSISLNVIKWDPADIIHYVQYSTEIPIEFYIADYIIPSAATARFYLKKPSGLEIYNECPVSGQKVTLKPTAQTFAESGRQNGQIQIIIGEDILVSFILKFDIERNLISDSAIESSNEFGILDELIKEAQKAISESGEATTAANEAAAAANKAADKAEDVIKDANTAIGGAEIATEAANTAAREANTSAQAASQAATAANKAAADANTAADRANDAAEAAGGTYSMVSGTSLAADTDLNMVIDIGNYRCTSPTTVATLKNCPTTQTFKLYVSNTALFESGAYRTQELYDLDGDKYERHTASSGEAWTAWEKTFNSRDIIEIANGGTEASNRATAIQNLLKLPDNTPPTADTPNAWAEFGNFTCYYGTGSTIINKPSGYGTLIQVLQTVGNALTIQQIWLGQQYGQMYVRAGNNVGWNGSADVDGGDAWRLHLDDVNTANYVVEQGTSGAWTYRKWSDGTSECWGSNPATYQTSSTEGGLYYALSKATLPSGLFISTPTSIVTVYGNWIGGASTGSGSTMSSLNIYTWTPTSDANTRALSSQVHCFGRWK